MLISKFNRMIHNKLVWGLFALVVSLSMFGLGAVSLRGNRARRDVEGTLFGKPVLTAELQAARMGTLGFRPRPDLSQEQLVELQRQTWRRVALLLDESRGAGWHAVAWDGRGSSGRPAGAGVYLLRVEAGGESLSRKFIRLD